MIKLRKKFIISATMIMALSMGTLLSVQANNHDDSYLTFNFRNSILSTSARAKLDDSSSWMKCNSMSVSGSSFTAHVYGAKTSGGNRYDASGGHFYTFYSGTGVYMTNLVKESGYSYAGMITSPNNGYSYNAAVAWSPDSI